MPVPIMQSIKSCLLDTLNLLLLHHEPFPFDAQKNSLVIGLKIIPSVICSSNTLLITIPTIGIPCIKLVVPSIGSITIVSSLPLIIFDSSLIYVDFG